MNNWTERVLEVIMALFDTTPLRAVMIYMVLLGLIVGVLVMSLRSDLKRVQEWIKKKLEELKKTEGT